MSRAVRETGTTDIETIIAEYRGRLFFFASRNSTPSSWRAADRSDLERSYGEFTMDPVRSFAKFGSTAL